MKKLTWNIVGKVLNKERSDVELEEKETPQGYNYRSRFGNSHYELDCPFCKLTLTIYPWSFRSVGRRCSCGALISCFTSYKIKEK